MAAKRQLEKISQLDFKRPKIVNIVLIFGGAVRDSKR